MKRYIKDGIIKSRNQIVIRTTKTIKGKDGKDKEVTMQTINPSEEMLLADGWVEYVQPEPTEEELLQRAKILKKREIEAYDKSGEVNLFYIGDTHMWLDKNTRSGLKLRFEAEKSLGRIDTVLWNDDDSYPLSLDLAIQMLYALEVYASACYDNTRYHISEVNKLETIEDIEAYDYRTGYPEKLRF